MMTAEERRRRIEQIRSLPADLEATVKGLTPDELNTRFIPGEWSVAQNVHHVADSHMNAFTRFKLLLTEDNPTVRPYDQDAWAELADTLQPPVQLSLDLLRSLHERWCVLLDSLTEADWARPGVHPASGPITMETLLETYSDHGIGHIDQINRALAAGREKAS